MMNFLVTILDYEQRRITWPITRIYLMASVQIYCPLIYAEECPVGGRLIQYCVTELTLRNVNILSNNLLQYWLRIAGQDHQQDINESVSRFNPLPTLLMHKHGIPAPVAVCTIE